jgi:hypothetical protein
MLSIQETSPPSSHREERIRDETSWEITLIAQILLSYSLYSRCGAGRRDCCGIVVPACHNDVLVAAEEFNDQVGHLAGLLQFEVVDAVIEADDLYGR